MRINRLILDNFKCFRHCEIEFNGNFNLLIGENGAGKTAVLDAVTKSLTAFFWGISAGDSKIMHKSDIRLFKTKEGSIEISDMSKITANALLETEKREINWHLQIFPRKKSKNHDSAFELINYGSALNKKLKDEKRDYYIDLPLIAFYSTARLWKEGRKDYRTKKRKENFNINNIPSRYRGYKNALQVAATFSLFLNWFRMKEFSMKGKSEKSFQLECVRNVVSRNIPSCKTIYWEFDPDKLDTLMVELSSGPPIPYSYLSDGYRNLLSIFADIAWRAVTLNPHYEADALQKTEGVVLIDELDLHLHPSWQQNIVQSLKKAFPKIQFIATTHSPFIIQEMGNDELIKLKTDAIKIKGANKLGLEDVAEEIQGVDSPNMSKERQEMFKAAEKYYALLEKAEHEKDSKQLTALRDRLNEIEQLYSSDVAYYAFLKQERLARGLK